MRESPYLPPFHSTRGLGACESGWLTNKRRADWLARFCASSRRALIGRGVEREAGSVREHVGSAQSRASLCRRDSGGDKQPPGCSQQLLPICLRL